MRRDWKPGDLIANDEGDRYWIVEVTANTRAAAQSGGAWQPGSSAVDADGNGWRVDRIEGARPLVVIDSEDPEQVERLTRLFGLECANIKPGSVMADHMQAALREYADPTLSIEEPTGLGAVVEDADGVRWVRAGDSHGGRASDNWRATRGGRVGWWSRYADLDVVRVLSDGVPEESA